MTQSNIAVPAASLSSTAGQSADAARPGRLALWVMLSGTFLVVLVPYLPAAPRRDWLLLPADLLSAELITP